MNTWNFEPTGPNGYEEEGIAAFEVFNQQNKLSPLEVLVRESIQNSCDARHEDLPGDEPVRVSFDLRELGPEDSDSFLSQIGWDQLGPHVGGTASQQGTLQERIKNDGLPQVAERRLRVMTVADYGTVGLWGGEGVDDEDEGTFRRLARSAMKTHEDAGSTKGGSFGLGKAIYWMTSGLSTVILHSVPASGPKAFENRLIGRAWLPSHKTGPDERWNNVGGWFGEETFSNKDQPRSVSLWGDDAASVAESLGAGRSTDETGTSFIIVGFDDPDSSDEPDVATICASLVRYVKKWYWPALCEGRLTVRVSGSAPGQDVPTETVTKLDESDAEVGHYVAAWNSRHSDEGGPPGASFSGTTFDWTVPERRSGGDEHPEQPAAARIDVAVVDGQLKGSDSRPGNSIALMRGATGMVVRYHSDKLATARFADAGKSYFGVLRTGYANGEDESDRHFEQFLRACEPPAHDEWSHQQSRVKNSYRVGKGGQTVRKALDRIIEDVESFVVGLIHEDAIDGKRSKTISRLLSFGGSGTTPPDDPKMIVRKGTSEFRDNAWHFTGASYGLNSNKDWPDADHRWAFKVWLSIPENGSSKLKSGRVPIKSFVATEGSSTDHIPRPEESAVIVVADSGVQRVEFNISTDPTWDSAQSRTRRIAINLEAVPVDPSTLTDAD